METAPTVLADVASALHGLSRADKLKAIHMLVEDLEGETATAATPAADARLAEAVAEFEKLAGREVRIWSQYDAHEAAAVMSRHLPHRAGGVQ